MKTDFFKFMKKVIFKFREDDITALAAMLSYSLILSFFPFLIFVLTLIGYSNLKADEVLLGMREILPNAAYELVKSTVQEVMGAKKGQLLSLSLLFTIAASSGGFSAVIKGLNMAYDEKEKRSFFRTRALSVVCTFGLTAIIMITVSLLVFGQLITRKLACFWENSCYYITLWNIMRYIIIICSLIFVFAALYRYTPCRRLGWKEVMPGTIFATVGWIIVSFGFAFYVNNFGNYSRLYGSIGAVFILLTWLFLTSIIILLGGEINAEIAFERK